MEFSKIGITNKGVIEISYVNYSTFVDQNNRKMSEPPLPSFPRALQDLAPHVAILCELTSVHLHDEIIVLSVHFKYHDDFGEGIAISSLWELSSGKSYTFTTPFYWSEGKANLSASTLARIDALKAEAGKYLHGERLQTRLELPPSSPADDQTDSGDLELQGEHADAHTKSKATPKTRKASKTSKPAGE